MNADSAPSTTILVSVDARGDRERLESHLSPSDAYTLVEGDHPRDVESRIDLWILDPSALERNYTAIDDVKAAQSPHYLPVLLLCPDEKLPSLRSTVWNHVDDVVSLPVTPAALDARIENSLRTRSLSEEALASQQRFDSLVNTTSGSIFFLTQDMTVQFVNEAGERLFGYDREELVGEPLTKIIPRRLQASAATAITDYQNRLDEGVAGGTLESVGRHADGHEIPIQLSYGWFELGGEIYLTGIVTDITALKQREVRLQVLNRVLRHDIRNDINLICGYAELLSEDPSVPREHLDPILSAATDIVRLSDHAQKLNRLFETDQQVKQRVDVRALVRRKAAAFRQQYPEATITTELPDDECLDAEAISLLDSVIDNLLENAITHNDTDAPEVTVTVRRERDETLIAVEITDNGPGLPPAEVRVIETGTETPLEHASGLGLWLVNWIVVESDGRIQFFENDPRGSRIRLLLPVARDPAGR